jgi:hypothetical protein
VGIGEEPDDDTAGREAKLPLDAWADTVVELEPDMAPGTVTIAWASDGDWSSIAIGGGTLAEPYAELIEHREGVGWLPERIVRLVKRWKPVALGCNGAGPTGAQVGPVLAALRAAELTIDIDQLGMNDWARACQGLHQDVREGRFYRPPDQDALDLAAENAGERRVGQGWAWDPIASDVSICPLEAVTAARALLPTEQPQSHEPLFAYT